MGATELKTSPGPAAPPNHGAPTTRRNTLLGILCMSLATMMFAASTAVMKAEFVRYPIGEVMFSRSLTSLLVCAAIILPTAGWPVFDTKKPKAHFARGLSQSISQTFTVFAVGLMPLAGAIAIGFSAPLFSSLISVLWLKERMDLPRFLALIVGFLGVLVVTHPGASSLQLGALFALANAVMYGSVTVAVRSMTKTEGTLTLLMWQLSIVAALHALLLAFGVKALTLSDAAALAGGGVAWGVGQYLWTKSLSLAMTTVVSPFYYLLLVWAMIIGYVVWGDAPSQSLLLGSAIVVLAGLALTLREARQKSAAAVASAGPHAAPANGRYAPKPIARSASASVLGALKK